MKRSFFETTTVCALVCLFLVGCQTSNPSAMGPGSFGTPLIAPQASLHAPQASNDAQQNVELSAPAAAGVTQVAFEQSVPVETVGFANGPLRVAVGALANRGANCNTNQHASECQSCNSGACGPKTGDCQTCGPQGYVEYVPQGWNAFGVDPQEFICDGGDHEPKARLTRDDQINGLQPEDTVVHYTSEAGDIKFQPSNRVCVYSPRFASIRKITGAVAGEKVTGLNQVDRPLGTEGINKDLPGLVMRDTTELARADMVKRLDFIRDRNRGVRVEGDLAPIQRSNVLEMMTTISALELNLLLDEQKALLEEHASAAIAWTIGESVQVAIEDMKPPVLTRDDSVEAFTVYEFPDAGRLRIIKMADKAHAQPGEEVGFVIRVQNVGDSTVNNVVITDNLVSRLEYVAESQTTDLKADFEAFPNSSESLRLEWRLSQELKVGESLLIEFRCKMR
ncbi:DUF11 domain-containing protein [Planctomycetes bacterium K23_9]|uniref:DUF11 domain-containing protein n=1 Tax=Stieleria marina TaxID=1930275 RepID=A0A517NPQ5_9BACT|nr:hypothetical protein K239x_10440 [Planctomycetes bacterium K23_9]